jgi:hypothetical protein
MTARNDGKYIWYDTKISGWMYIIDVRNSFVPQAKPFCSLDQAILIQDVEIPNIITSSHRIVKGSDLQSRNPRWEKRYKFFAWNSGRGPAPLRAAKCLVMVQQCHGVMMPKVRVDGPIKIRIELQREAALHHLVPSFRR